MKAFYLCALILAAACAAYATDRHAIRPADASSVEAAEPYWIPMSFDIETVPPLADATEPAERRIGQQARVPISATDDLQQDSSPSSVDRTRASDDVGRMYSAVPSPSSLR